MHASPSLSSHEHDWQNGRLTHGITPPKKSTQEARRREIAATQTARIAALPIDALVVYDLQDETSRTDVERPFPFLQTVDPLGTTFDWVRALGCRGEVS